MATTDEVLDLTSPTDPSQDQSVAQIAKQVAIDAINSGHVDYKTLVEIAAKFANALPKAATENTLLAGKFDLPDAITEEQRTALVRVAEVFGKVNPIERRALQPSEVVDLLDERAVLDDIVDMAESRKKGIRSIVFNGLDVAYEESLGDEPSTAEVDVDGHYIVAGELAVSERTKQFKREVRNGSPSIDTQKLRVLADDPNVDYITHDDYLAMTRQERVFDEEATVILLRKKPELIAALGQATVLGKSTAALYVRNKPKK